MFGYIKIAMESSINYFKRFVSPLPLFTLVPPLFLSLSPAYSFYTPPPFLLSSPSIYL